CCGSARSGGLVPVVVPADLAAQVPPHADAGALPASYRRSLPTMVLRINLSIRYRLPRAACT
ncbi:hypothetical protein FOZ62_020643, partial [Perkinsus olseni]